MGRAGPFGIVFGVNVPDSRSRSTGRGSVAGYVVPGCAVLGCLLAACGSTVPGHPAAQVPQSAATTRHTGTDLATMLPTQTQFPAAYSAMVLPSGQATGATADLTGIPAGATVDPTGCASPPPAVRDLAVVVGTDDDTRATITVELTRTAEPLDRLRSQLQRCGTVHADRGPVTNTIVTQLVPPAPVNADDSLAWSRTVSGQRSGPGLTRSMRTLAAQIGDVRIIATYLSFGTDQPDMVGLDQVFTATVGDVRKG